MFKIDEDSETNRLTFSMAPEDPTKDEIDHLISSIKIKLNQYKHIADTEILVSKCIVDF